MTTSMNFSIMARLLNAGVSHPSAAMVLGSTSNTIVSYVSLARRAGHDIIQVRKDPGSRLEAASRALLRAIAEGGQLDEPDAVLLIAEAGSIPQMIRTHDKLAGCGLVDRKRLAWLINLIEGTNDRRVGRRDETGIHEEGLVLSPS